MYQVIIGGGEADNYVMWGELEGMSGKKKKIQCFGIWFVWWWWYHSTNSHSAPFILIVTLHMMEISIGVATSQHLDGPFSFRRAFYPDGNVTHDQV